ncbi:unnamed protein product [Ambrosiozyma monospora]|uniref:Unnamed protein product n=1 Tax=Ambrosiozyma monospora TaxID=43982 RepID=A0ACB5U9T0_AMBMO|nr:unnamed protein product [Ambrosiozyma monospora]
MDVTVFISPLKRLKNIEVKIDGSYKDLDLRCFSDAEGLCSVEVGFKKQPDAIELGQIAKSVTHISLYLDFITEVSSYIILYV